ncbi:hypothetical protein Rs2_42418 [Raphanus sativus]|nr:hypothetical protein Rs2_42418 [Raphanus sativus]
MTLIVPRVKHLQTEHYLPLIPISSHLHPRRSLFHCHSAIVDPRKAHSFDPARVSTCPGKRVNEFSRPNPFLTVVNAKVLVLSRYLDAYMRTRGCGNGVGENED